jgi:Xaa-Pro dipeptidase
MTAEMAATERVLHFSEEEYAQRLANVRREMAERGIRTLLTHTPENIYYLTGYQTPGYYMYQVLIVPESGEPLILTRGMEETNVRAGSWIQNRATYLDTEDVAEVTSRAMGEAGYTEASIGLEKESWFLTIGQYERLRRALGSNTEVVDSSGLIESLRVVKSPAEVEFIRKAAVAASEGMRGALETMAPGRTENDLAIAIHRGIIGAGGEYMSLPPFVASGPRSYLAHATWDNRRLEQGDVVFIELSGVVRRYSAALMRCFYLGDRPPPEIQRMAEASLAALNAVLEAARPGLTAEDVDRVSRETYPKYGYSLGKRTGYSIGINFPPDWGEGHALSLREGETRVLEPGMVFHVPSTVRIWGLAAVSTSETFLITDDGCEVLTDFPRRLTLVSG